VSTRDANAKALAGACSEAFFEGVPPTICWKSGADVGIMPYDCPDGYHRLLALCFKDCDPGYTFDGAALCLKDCPAETTWYPLTCTYWTWKIWKIYTVGREPYFPKSLTNFDTPCPKPEGKYYKGLALCYRDCNAIGMANCGIGMCSATSDSCASGLGSMLTDFFSGLAKGVGFILSFGTSSIASEGLAAAKTGLKTLANKASGAIKSGFKALKNIASGPLKTNFLNKMKQKAIQKVKSKIASSITDELVNTVCGEVGDKLLNKVASSSDNAGNGFDVSKLNLDLLGIGDIVSSCGSIKDASGGMGCAKSILSSLDNIDPTGLAGMASAFMQPICDV